MSKTVVLIPDIHLWYKDIGTIKGSKKAVENIILEIIDRVRELGIDHIILGGDVCHAGYKDDIVTFHNHYTLLENLSKASKAENYMIGGNHGLQQLNTNLEVYINQPSNNNLYKPSEVTFYPAEPLFEMKPYVEIEGVIFSLHSFNPRDKEYYTKDSILQGKKHIAIYHDMNMFSDIDFSKTTLGVNQSYYQNYMYNVDVAVVNHIHTKYANFFFNKTLFIVPGSVFPTSTSIHEISAEYVDLPLFIINNGEFEISSIPISRRLKEVVLLQEDVKRTKVNPLKQVVDKASNFIGSTNFAQHVQRNQIHPVILKVIEMTKSGELDNAKLAELYDEYRGITNITNDIGIEV